jgi:hypothetical protein
MGVAKTKGCKMKKSQNNRTVNDGQAITTKQAVVKMPTPAEFFAEYTLTGVASWDEINVLGHNNVKYLLARARDNEKSETNEIDRLQNRKGLFEAALKWLTLNPGKCAGDYFAELAKSYDNPQFKPNEIGKRPGSWGDDLEPLTPESETRKAGSTNFNICGWCNHSGGGSCRYSYHISTSCQLLATYPETVAREGMKDYLSLNGDNPNELKFNTPCLMQKLTAREVEATLRGIDFNIQAALAKRETARAVINKLLEQRRATNEAIKPWLVGNRPCEYMNVGDPMVVYIGGWGKDCIVKGDWINAIGIFGYRHHDGCMSYQAQFPIHTNASYYEGRGGGAGMSRPEAVLATEFALLVSMVQKLGPKATYAELMKSTGNKNPEQAFLRIWFKNIERQKLESFSCEKFFEALKSPNFATPPAGWTPQTEEIKVETVKDAEHVLQMLDSKFFKTEDEITSWVNMQLQAVHPDKHQSSSPEVQAYAARQTKAVIAARDLLLKLRKEA